jgi:membrane protease YdiL (CAAX protease family)
VTRASPSTIPRWGLGAAALGWVGGMVCGGLALGLWIAVTGDDDRALGALAVAQVGFWVGLVGAVLVTSRLGGSGNPVRDFRLRFRAVDAPVGIGAGLVAQLVVVPLIYLPFRSVIDRRDLERPARELADRAHGTAFLVLAVIIIVGAPFVEELFFRGLLLRSLQEYVADGPAIVLSGVIFGITHFGLLQLPALAFMGVVFAVLAVRAGRLGPAIWAHMAFNATTVIALALER